MAELRFTILGCGSSGGVPRLGGMWGDCDPNNPKNRRRRCSMLVERITQAGTTTVLIDTSPDMREQLLDAKVVLLDAVLFTHGHADHVHGIDDLRQIVFNRKERLDVWADGPTQERLLGSFGYAFIQPEGSPYPPILDMHTLKGDMTITGAGGAITFTPLKVGHGTIDAFLHGFTHQALTELLAQQCHRHFAFAEALHFDSGLRFFELFFDFRVKLCSSDRDRVTALEAFVQGLGDLHLCSVLLVHGAGEGT